MLTPVKAVLLDALQTLIDLDPSFPGAFARVCNDFGYWVRESDVAKVMPLVEAFEKERLKNESNLSVTNEYLEELWLRMNRFIFEQVGITGDAEKLSIEMERRFEHGSFTRLFPDTLPVLRRLRDQGLTIGIVSNGTASIMNCLKYHGIDRYVDFILVSGLVGWEKPSPRIFEIALQHASAIPEETLFIGDHYICDIEGARRVGIRPLMITRKTPSACPDCDVIHSLEELFTYL